MKKWREVLVIAIFIVLAGLYAWQKWPVEIYDTTYNTSATYPSLTGTDTLSQEFTVYHNGLCGIQIRLVLSGRTDFDPYTWTVATKNGEVVASGIIDPNEADYKGDYKILFDNRLSDSKGMTYVFTIAADQVSTEDKSLTCYQSVAEKGAGTVTYNGEAQEGSLMLKGIEKYFDVETFIMGFCLLLYLAFFIRFMSKLFS